MNNWFLSTNIFTLQGQTPIRNNETGFEGSYESVKRFVRKLDANTGLPHRRMETPPGQCGVCPCK
jgi:hypothetical protein